MPMGMPEWDEKAESAQEINRAFNDVLDVLVDADMWTGDPPYRGVSAAEQVKMLVRRAEAAEAERDKLRKEAKIMRQLLLGAALDSIYENLLGSITAAACKIERGNQGVLERADRCRRAKRRGVRGRRGRNRPHI